MFGKLAADVLGISDIGRIVMPEDYNKTDSDDYVFSEENEKIYFLIKSKTDEYCFTNRALIHLDGTSAMSKKRLLRRSAYYTHRVHHVHLETAGTIDLDVEIKFHLGDREYSIDVDKKQIELLKDLYKALLKIAEIQHDNAHALELSYKGLDSAIGAMGRVTRTDNQMAEQLRSLNEYTFGYLHSQHEKYTRKDFGEVYEKFINT